jgi:hypothetical protein
VRDALFPDSRILQVTIPGVQLYQFPLMLKTKAVYVAGALSVPTDIPTLEGRQIGAWDNTGDGSVIPGPYADVPPNSGGTAAPRWTVTTPLSYPSTNGQWVTPAPDAQPWDDSQRPRYYWRGGWLGLVPIPTNETTIAIDGVRQPDTITQMAQALPTPENFLDAIVWAACSIAKFADDGARAAAQQDVAEKNYEREKRKIIEWRGEYPGEQRDGPKVSTLRPAFGRNRMRRNLQGSW